MIPKFILQKMVEIRALIKLSFQIFVRYSNNIRADVKSLHRKITIKLIFVIIQDAVTRNDKPLEVRGGRRQRPLLAMASNLECDFFFGAID